MNKRLLNIIHKLTISSLFGVFLLGTSPQKEKALSHFMQGEFLMNQGNYAMAVLEFQDAISYDPNASTIHISISDAYRRLGRMKRVEDHLRIALDLEPENIEAKEMLGQFFITEKNYIESQKIFLELNKQDSANIDYIFTLADLARVQKKWELAIDYYILGYNNSQAISGLEQALQIALTTNNFKKGKQICLLLLEESPDEIKLLETLRDLALFTKDYLTAYNTILKIEEVLGSSVEIYFQKSALQEELNNIELAINFMYEAYSVDSSNIDVLQRIVTLLMDQDKNEEALLYNEKITKKFPNDSKGFINIALMALSAEKPEEAIDILGRNSEKFIDDFTLQYLLGSAYYQKKNYTDAKYHLNQALVIFPESRNTKHNLALIYDATNERVKSDKLYTELISSDSLDAQAYNNFAYSLVERNENLDLALELSLTAIRLSPQSAAYLDTAGWIYYKMKQFDKAVKYIEESLEIDSSNITIQQHLNEIINNRTELNQSKIQQVEN